MSAIAAETPSTATFSGIVPPAPVLGTPGVVVVVPVVPVVPVVLVVTVLVVALPETGVAGTTSAAGLYELVLAVCAKASDAPPRRSAAAAAPPAIF